MQQTHQAGYGRVISITSKTFGVFGILLGLVCFYGVWPQNPNWIGFIVGLISFGMVFWAFGLGITFLLAPRNYLESFSGRRWRLKVGIKSVTGARVACAIYVLLIGPIIALLIAWLVLRPAPHPDASASEPKPLTSLRDA
jgi:hypothetical protein